MTAAVDINLGTQPQYGVDVPWRGDASKMFWVCKGCTHMNWSKSKAGKPTKSCESCSMQKAFSVSAARFNEKLQRSSQNSSKSAGRKQSHDQWVWPSNASGDARESDAQTWAQKLFQQVAAARATSPAKLQNQFQALAEPTTPTEPASIAAETLENSMSDVSELAGGTQLAETRSTLQTQLNRVNKQISELEEEDDPFYHEWRAKLVKRQAVLKKKITGTGSIENRIDGCKGALARAVKRVGQATEVRAIAQSALEEANKALTQAQQDVQDRNKDP